MRNFEIRGYVQTYMKFGDVSYSICGAIEGPADAAKRAPTLERDDLVQSGEDRDREAALGQVEGSLSASQERPNVLRMRTI